MRGHVDQILHHEVCDVKRVFTFAICKAVVMDRSVHKSMLSAVHYCFVSLMHKSMLKGNKEIGPVYRKNMCIVHDALLSK